MRNHREFTETPFKDVSLEIEITPAKQIGEMSKTALKLYLYIREYSIRSAGVIFFDKAEAKAICGFKQNKSIYNALNQLVDLEVLAGMKDPTEFYYNPRFIDHEKE